LYSQYIPSGISEDLYNEMEEVINNSFWLGSQQSHAKGISDILDTDASRKISAD